MDKYDFQPHELTPEYLLARINILEDALTHVMGICASYMPPDGQGFLAELVQKLDQTNEKLGDESKAHLESKANA